MMFEDARRIEGADRDIALLRAPFYFLRHGETEWNRLGLVAGSTDVALNETGWAQARHAAERLQQSGIDALWSSPLKRALDTSGCIAELLRLEVAVVEDLAERDWGALEGKPRALRAHGACPPGGESLETFRQRTLRGLASIRPSRVPLVVAHSGTFRVLAALLGLPVDAAPVTNGAPLRLRNDAAQTGRWICEPV